MKRFGPFTNSVNTMLLCLMLAVILLFVGAVTVQTQNAVRVVKDRVAEANQNIITLYLREIDGDLYTTSIQMINLALNNENYIALKNAGNADTVFMARAALANRLSQERLLMNNLDGLFVYDPDSRSYLYSESYDVSRTLHAAVLRQIAESGAAGVFSEGCHWTLYASGETCYLLFLREQNRMYYGAWVRVSELTANLAELELGESGGVTFVDENGTALTAPAFLAETDLDLTGNDTGTGVQGKYIVLRQTSRYANIDLVAVSSVRYLLHDIPQMQLLTILLAVIMLIVAAVIFVLMRKKIVRPLQTLVGAMRKIGEGDLSVRVEPEEVSAEYTELFESFNSMAAQIESLKISVYEEQLGRQRAELQYLQLQVNPHFYVNYLNNICSLAMNGKNEQIVELCGLLADYFRYKLGKGAEFVTLREEFQHAEIYMHIQEMRYPGKFSYRIELPAMLDEILIPALTVEIFVENIFKYAGAMDRELRIDVSAELTVRKGIPAAVIHILDDGQGFPREILYAVERRELLQTDSGHRIGIQNGLMRFDFQYGDTAQVRLYNRENGGAGVELILPLEPPAEERKDV